MLWLCFSVTLSFIVAWDHSYSWEHAVYHFIKNLVLYVMIVGAIAEKKDLKIFVWVFILMFAYLAYEPAFYFLTGTSGSQQMYGTNYIAEIGILAGHVALANNVNQMIPIVLFLYFGVQNRIFKIILTTCFLIFFIALIGSGSRGGIIGMVVWALCIIWFPEKRVKMVLLVSILFAILFISYGSHISQTANRINSSSLEERLIGLSHGTTILRKGNILGAGPGCFLFARKKYHGYYMESHNIYGQIIGDLGLPGIVVTFLLILHVFKEINFIKRNLDRENELQQFYYYLIVGIQVSLITRLAISMASHGLYYFYWYTLAAIIVVTRKLLNEDGQIPSDDIEKLSNDGHHTIPAK